MFKKWEKINLNDIINYNLKISSVNFILFFEINVGIPVKDLESIWEKNINILWTQTLKVLLFPVALTDKI